jgi:predicted O-methyltransferase YrrM
VSLMEKVHERFNILNSLMWNAVSTKPALETVYRDLFVRDLTRLELNDLYYPVGGAANYGLLYLITRCFLELPIRNAIEMGAGQSSILLSRLNERLKKNANITTIEHDGRWAENIQTKVNHRVKTADLVSKTVSGHRINFYGGTFFDPSILYDFVLIDGPPARNTEETVFNRLGALELIEKNLADDFVVIVDDAERRGEGVLVNLIRRQLQENGRDFKETAIMAAKQQAVFVAGSYYSAAYF